MNASEDVRATGGPLPRAAGPEGSIEALASLRTQLDRIEAMVEGLTRQASFLPPQIRQLAGKIDGVALSITEQRFRALLLGLLAIYDLVDQVCRTSEHAGRREDNHEVLRVQLLQLLDASGLHEIPTSGRFDPQLHRALTRVPVADPARDDLIVDVLRRGFRTDQSVLRYAEVSVGHYTVGAGRPSSTDPDAGEPGDPVTASSVPA